MTSTEQISRSDGEPKGSQLEQLQLLTTDLALLLVREEAETADLRRALSKQQESFDTLMSSYEGIRSRLSSLTAEREASYTAVQTLRGRYEQQLDAESKRREELESRVRAMEAEGPAAKPGATAALVAKLQQRENALVNAQRDNQEKQQHMDALMKRLALREQESESARDEASKVAQEVEKLKSQLELANYEMAKMSQMQTYGQHQAAKVPKGHSGPSSNLSIFASNAYSEIQLFPNGDIITAPPSAPAPRMPTAPPSASRAHSGNPLDAPAVKSYISSLQATIRRVQDDLQLQERERDSANDQRSRWERRCRVLEAELRKTRVEREEMLARWQTAVAECKRITARAPPAPQVQELEMQVRRLAVKVVQQEAELQNKRDQEAELAASLNSKDAELTKYRGEIQACREDVSRLRKALLDSVPLREQLGQQLRGPSDEEDDDDDMDSQIRLVKEISSRRSANSNRIIVEEDSASSGAESPDALDNKRFTVINKPDVRSAGLRPPESNGASRRARLNMF